jgi:hypothetical protein
MAMSRPKAATSSGGFTLHSSRDSVTEIGAELHGAILPPHVSGGRGAQCKTSASLTNEVIGPHGMRSIAGVIVTFTKPLDLRHFPVWVAANGKCRIQGASMGCHDPRLPHDIVTLVIERELGIRDGFFDTVASGGTFKSMGKRRNTFGRGVIARNRLALQRSEHLVHRTLSEWQTGIRNAATEALDAAEAAWGAVAPGATLSLEWDTHRRPFAPSRARQHSEQRRRARR